MRALIAQKLLRFGLVLCLLSALACVESELGPTTGAGGGDPSPSAGFPRTAAAVSVALKGPYSTANYAAPSNPTLGPSTIFYPTNAPAPFAILALCPGFTNVQEDFLWWGPVMASHGFVLLVLSPLDTLLDFPAERADDLAAAIEILRSESTRAASPLNGKLDVSRAGLMGHSMGGGGVLLELDRASSKYRAGIAMEPWELVGVATVSTPTLIIAGEADIVADPESMGWTFYQQIPASTKKVYAELAGVGHNTPNNLGTEEDHRQHAQWAIAFAKKYLEDDARYDSYLQNGSTLSRFARTP
jgi:predicted dienelactone hydrolase